MGKLWVAAFADVGDVQADTITIRPGSWMYSAGTGVRYQTPLGPIRFDVAFRLNRDETRFAGTKMWGFHISLGEVF